MKEFAAHIAVNRFGLGARPGELATAAHDPRGWLSAQLVGDEPRHEALRKLESTQEILGDISKLNRARARDSDGKRDEQAQKNYQDRRRKARQSQAQARILHSVTTAAPFRERLVQFWNNHFAISIDKVPVTPLAGSFEMEAIRPHVNGYFAEMLIAAEQHPAMILYLDNQRSIGPHSQIGKRAEERRPERNLGLNENLAREILELHTLGVDGGYSQADVLELAKAITGWTVAAGQRRLTGNTPPGQAVFVEAMHEPGARMLLGKNYAARGYEQGKTMLLDLALHPSTARFIATKLARHFIADQPSQPSIDQLTQSFVQSKGHLPTVYKTLLSLPEAWAVSFTKFKSPWEYVISTLRLFGQDDFRPGQIMNVLRRLGQIPYLPGSPAGFADTAEEWGGPDAVLKRIEWAVQIGNRAGALMDANELAVASLGEALTAETAQAIRRAESRTQALTLLLASPEFMRR